MPPLREIELKFRCGPDDLDRALAAAPAGPEVLRQLVSTYFDTPDHALAAQGASLRTREGGGGRVQTLKVGKGVSREEHEGPCAAERPHFPRLDELLSPDQIERLAPVLQIRVWRRERVVNFAGALVEIAADLGEAEAGGRTAPICELELELKSGPWRALFALARELRRTVPLQLSFESKSAQGRRLLEDI